MPLVCLLVALIITGLPWQLRAGVESADAYGEAGVLFLPFHLPFLGASSWGLMRKDNDTRMPYRYPVDGKIEIDAKKMGQCFAVAAAAITGKGQKISFDTSKIECRPLWLGKKGSEPDLLEYLGADGERRCDYSTGRESDLKKWVVNQNDNSIHPYSLFKKSLEIHDGNIWSAIIAIHQVLRPHARWYDTGRYSFEGDNVRLKDAQALFDKLVDIRGDLWELNPKELHGDHAGSWYRIWGAMIFQIDHESHEAKARAMQLGRCSIEGPGVQEEIGTLWHSFKNTLVFYGDERLMKIEEEDLGKFRTDMAGANSAQAMMSALKYFDTEPSTELLKRHPTLKLPSEKECEEKTYLFQHTRTWDDVPLAKPVKAEPYQAPSSSKRNKTDPSGQLIIPGQQNKAGW